MRFLAIKKKKKYNLTLMSLENIHLFIKQTFHITTAILLFKTKINSKINLF